MRNSPLKGMLKASPTRKNYPTKDYSAEATKGNAGDKIASAVIPKNLTDLIPTGKIVKAAKFIKNIVT